MSVDKINLRNFIILLFWLLVFVVGLFIAVRVNESVDGIKNNLDLITQEKRDQAGPNADIAVKTSNQDQDKQQSLKDRVQWKQYRNYEFGFAFDYPAKFELEEGRIDENGQFHLDIYPDSSSVLVVNATKADQNSFDSMAKSQMYSENEVNGVRTINANGYNVEHFYQIFRFLGEDYEYEFVYQDKRIKIDVFNQFENVVEGHILDTEIENVNGNLELLSEIINSFYLLDDEK